MHACNALLAVALCFALCPHALAETEQAQQRQQARGVRQDTRQTARQVKQNCVEADQKSNSECLPEQARCQAEGTAGSARHQILNDARAL